MVTPTDAINAVIFCAFVKSKSGPMVEFSRGACENQPKKQRKKAIQLRWKVLIWTDLKSSKLIFVAFSVLIIIVFIRCIFYVLWKQRYF